MFSDAFFLKQKPLEAALCLTTELLLHVYFVISLCYYIIIILYHYIIILSYYIIRISLLLYYYIIVSLYCIIILSYCQIIILYYSIIKLLHHYIIIIYGLDGSWEQLAKNEEEWAKYESCFVKWASDKC